MPFKKANDKALRPVRPNLGIEMAYRRKLYALIDEMHNSIKYWLTAAYKANTPRIAQDTTPADELAKAIRGLKRRWLRNFNRGAEQLAEYFTQSVNQRSDAALRKILKDAGFAVEFRMTKTQRDILDATVHENVSLIKSIPQQYLTQVEGSVMRSVTAGRDLATLSEELQQHYEVTKRRAALISRDQNNKVTAAFNRARRLELGLEDAIWVHSHAGKEPRPTHKANDGKRFSIREGWLDPAEGRHVQPGELINCRCTSRPVVKGLS